MSLCEDDLTDSDNPYHMPFMLEHMCALFLEEFLFISCSHSRFYCSVGVIHAMTSTVDWNRGN